MPKKRTGRDDVHVMQIDPGWFKLSQNGSEVGQVVVVSGSPSTNEYYYLYNGNCGPGQGIYTWPSSKNTKVVTEYDYAGTMPTGFDPNNPIAYEQYLKPTVTFVSAVCTQSLVLEGNKRRAPKRKR